MNYGSVVRRWLYATILVLLTFYLWSLGSGPWLNMIILWPVMISVMMVAPFSLAIQVATFSLCMPSDVRMPPWPTLMRIWAVASMTSLVAPLFAGLAVRATLLQHQGVPIKATGLATARQMWLNVEYAVVITGVLLLLGIPGLPRESGGLILLGWLALRAGARAWLGDGNRREIVLLRPFLHTEPLRLRDRVLLAGQIFIMAINYYLAYNLAGADLALTAALLMATVTILSTLIIIIPNGVGILDAFWVFMAMHHHLDLDEAVALAITMRLSFLVGAGVVWIFTLFGQFCRGKES